MFSLIATTWQNMNTKWNQLWQYCTIKNINFIKSIIPCLHLYLPVTSFYNIYKELHSRVASRDILVLLKHFFLMPLFFFCFFKTVSILLNHLLHMNPSLLIKSQTWALRFSSIHSGVYIFERIFPPFIHELLSDHMTSKNLNINAEIPLPCQ